VLSVSIVGCAFDFPQTDIDADIVIKQCEEVSQSHLGMVSSDFEDHGLEDTSSDEQQSLFNDYNPCGNWEIVDSIRAYPVYAPYESEPWPLEPIDYGGRITISDSVFSIDEYKEFNDGMSGDFHFSVTKYASINLNYFWRFRLTSKAYSWIYKNLPEDAVTIRFYQDEEITWYYYPDREVFFVNTDTIIYIDAYYAYLLVRVTLIE